MLTAPSIRPEVVLIILLAEHKILFSKYVSRLINKAIIEDADEICLFHMLNLGEYRMKKDLFESALDEIEKVFIQFEEYEMVADIRKIRDKLHIYKLIKNTHTDT